MERQCFRARAVSARAGGSINQLELKNEDKKEEGLWSKGTIKTCMPGCSIIFGHDRNRSVKIGKLDKSSKGRNALLAGTVGPLAQHVDREDLCLVRYCIEDLLNLLGSDVRDRIIDSADDNQNLAAGDSLNLGSRTHNLPRSQAWPPGADLRLGTYTVEFRRRNEIGLIAGSAAEV